MDALVEAGVRAFDVASLVEIERVSRIPDAELYFMNFRLIVARAIVRAYREFGVRSFAFDSDEELDKIVQATGGAEDPRPVPPPGLSQHAQPHSAGR